MARSHCDIPLVFVAEGKFAGYVSASIWSYTIRHDQIGQKSGQIVKSICPLLLLKRKPISNEHLLSWKKHFNSSLKILKIVWCNSEWPLGFNIQNVSLKVTSNEKEMKIGVMRMILD